MTAMKVQILFLSFMTSIRAGIYLFFFISTSSSPASTGEVDSAAPLLKDRGLSHKPGFRSNRVQENQNARLYFQGLAWLVYLHSASPMPRNQEAFEEGKGAGRRQMA